jgi:hypothetical protein
MVVNLSRFELFNTSLRLLRTLALGLDARLGIGLGGAALAPALSFVPSGPASPSSLL